MDKSCVVNGAIVLILRMSRLVGLAPVSITPVNNGYRISLSKFASYYRYVVISFVYIVGTADFILDIYTNSTPDSGNHLNLLEYIQWMVQFFLITILLSVGILSSFRRMKTFIEYAQINKKNIKSKERNRSIMMWFILMLRFIFLVSNCYHAYSSRPKFLIIIICVKYLNNLRDIVLSILELQVILMAFEINKYLEAIEEDMSRLNKEIISAKKNGTRTCDIRTSLQALGNDYNMTCDIIEQYNESYGFITLMSFSLFTLKLTFALNNILRSIDLPDIRDAIERSCVEIMWILFHVTRAIMFVEPWFQISKQVDKIKSHLGYITPIGGEIALEAEVFYLQIMLNKPELSPLGLFTMSRSLLGQIVLTVLSYTIVVCQINYNGKL